MGRPRKLFVLAGQRFGRGTVLEPEIVMTWPQDLKRRERGARLRCDCGTIYEAQIKHLIAGNITSCGCAFREASADRIKQARSPGPRRRLFITAGQRFGRGTVINPEVRISRRSDLSRTDRGAQLRCDCGTIYEAQISNLVNGSIQSCGCARNEIAAAHMRRLRGSASPPLWERPPSNGMTGHPLFQIWSGMLDRCENPANSRYKRYGGRGITVCDRWHDVRLFIADIEATIGQKPARCPECGGRYSLDRIKNSRGYEPGNVRWATAVVQNGNKGD